MSSSNDRTVGSDHQRLQLFLDLAGHYVRVCEELPLPEGSNKFRIAFEDRPLPLALEIRVMLLRKFVEEKSYSNVNLKKVARSFHKCYTGDSEFLQRNIDSFVESVDSVMRGEVGIKYGDDPDEMIAETFFEVLYGGLLHADWGRWQRLQEPTMSGNDFKLFVVFDRLDRLLREAHHSIETAIAKGEITMPTP